MFCPNCGFQDQSQSKFCKRCGTNLKIVTEALAGRLSAHDDDELARRRAIEDALLIDALKRRRRLLTVGIMMGCLGVGMTAMFALVTGNPKAAAAGLLPLMIGLGLTLSGLFLYKPTLPWQTQSKRKIETTPQIGAATQALTSNPASAPESVTTETTRRLEESPPPRQVTE